MTTENITETEKPKETEKNGREYQEFPGGPFKKENPGGGRPKETEEEKLAREIRQEAVDKIKEDYLLRLAESLPEINPALIEKAKGGDVSAIKEIHDQVFGKPPSNIKLSGDKDNPLPILVKFIDGKEAENNGNTDGIQETV